MGEGTKKGHGRKKALKEVQKKIKEKSRKLKASLERESNQKRRSMLKDELAVLSLQRKKVIQALRELQGKDT